jgi:hypothetical protein
VEDGRFFLLSAQDRYDLITAEPPPPKNAGVVNLYSREYFELAEGRLNEGGVVTYWLPVDQLRVRETRAIVRAFCSAFADCSLWSGGGSQWMLAGTRGAPGPVDEERFARQWKDPDVGPEMRRLDLETPEVMGALFVADAPQLRSWAGESPPLEDSWPRRLTPGLPDPSDVSAHRAFSDAIASRARFEESAWIRERWPPAIRQRALDYFEYRAIFDEMVYGRDFAGDIDAVRHVLTRSPLRTLPLVMMGTSPAQIEIARRAHARGIQDPGVEFLLGADGLAVRDFPLARRHFDAALLLEPSFELAQRYRSLTLGLLEAGDDVAAPLARRR